MDAFVAKTGANRKLKRLWGTSTVVIDGLPVEVLNARRHYHKPDDRPENYEQLFKFLRVFKDVEDYKGQGIKSAWFTLNKSNGPENLDVSSSYIVDNLNRMWWDDSDGLMPEDLTLTTSIVISESFDNYSNLDFSTWGTTEEEIAEYIKLNYETLWGTKKIVQEGVGVINKGSSFDEALNAEVQDEDDLSPDDPWMAILSRYALRESGVPCTIKNVEIGLGNAKEVVYNTVVVTIEIPYYQFISSDTLVQRVLDDLDTEVFPKDYTTVKLDIFNGLMANNEQVTQTLAKQVNYYETVDDIDVTVLSRQYLQWEDSTIQASIYENFWVQDGDKWYFKADVIDNPKLYGTTHPKLNAYVFSLLDTGYKKKKVPLWKKIVAVILFIVAVVLAFFDYSGQSSSYLFTAAYAILVGAFVVALTSAIFGAFGMNEWAMAFAWVSKEIEPLVFIASVIMIIDVVGQAIQSIQKLGLTEVVGNVISDMAADFVTGLGDVMTGTISSQSVSVLTKTIDAYSKNRINKIESINSRNVDLKAQHTKLIEETSMESDVVKSYMNIYSKPATADWSIYASTFDMPYERGGGMLSIGNIQKTTKQALRKADYEEPMFDGIILV